MPRPVRRTARRRGAGKGRGRLRLWWRPQGRRVPEGRAGPRAGSDGGVRCDTVIPRHHLARSVRLMTGRDTLTEAHPLDETGPFLSHSPTPGCSGTGSIGSNVQELVNAGAVSVSGTGSGAGLDHAASSPLRFRCVWVAPPGCSGSGPASPPGSGPEVGVSVAGPSESTGEGGAACWESARTNLPGPTRIQATAAAGVSPWSAEPGFALRPRPLPRLVLRSGESGPGDASGSRGASGDAPVSKPWPESALAEDSGSSGPSASSVASILEDDRPTGRDGREARRRRRPPPGTPRTRAIRARYGTTSQTEA